MKKLRLDYFLIRGALLSFGDIYVDNYSGLEFTVKDADRFKSKSGSDSLYHVTSFTDRKNTGEKPVPDDFPVVVTYSNGADHEDSAFDYDWSVDEAECLPIASWKPDIDKLIEQQAEYDKKENKVEVSKEMQIVQAINDSQGEPVDIELDKYPHIARLVLDGDRCNGSIHAGIYNSRFAIYEYICTRDEFLDAVDELSKAEWMQKRVENVYTQEMKDNGELPSVGMKCEVKYSGGGTFSNAIIKFISDYGVVHADAETGVEIFCGSINALDINPYKTTEQIELEEAKKKQLEDMCFKYKNLPLEVAMQMQANGDLPEIVIDDLSARGMAKQ